MTTTFSVTTDFTDYAPGSTAYISASGIAAGSKITFRVQHVKGPGLDGVYGTADDDIEVLLGEGHDPWDVIDGGIGDLDGLMNGAILTSWYVNPDDSPDERFLLTAELPDGQLATAGFTDSAGSTNKVYQHWADGDASLGSTADWNNNILNANKSDYFEGEVVPHVFIYKASNSVPLENGQTYSFTISYDYYQQNTDAIGFEFITTFDVSRSPGPLDVTDPYVAPTLDASYVNYGGFTDFGDGAQGFHTVDADITEVSQVTASGSGSESHQVTIYFVYTGDTTTNGVAEIYYGLRIASPTDTHQGASAWTGGSLQTTVDIGGSGATSLQLNPAAIIVGTISGYKFEDINGNGVWDDGEGGLAGWTIFLDENGNGELDDGEMSDITDSDGMYSFSVSPDADKSTPDTNDPYVVREVSQDGWIQKTINPEPITITALDPTELNVNFGNQQALPSLSLSKITGDGEGGIEDGDAVTLIRGGTVVWTYMVTNDGNVDLSAPTVMDDNGTEDEDDDFAAEGVLDEDGFNVGDTGQDGVFGVGEVWQFTASGTVVEGDYANLGTAVASYGDEEVSDTDESSYFGESPTGALIAPTGTTPLQYIDGTAMTFQDYYASQGGVIQYGVRSGYINNTNPGVFFYFTGATGSIKSVDGPDSDSLADEMTVVIDQSRDSDNAWMTTPFKMVKNGFQVYKVISADDVIDASDSLVAVKATALANSDGDISITFTPDAVDTMYVVSVKYSTTASFVGGPLTNSASWPTVNYQFDTLINASIIESYAGGIDLAPKHASLLMLEGSEGDGAPAIRAAQAKAAYKAALSWWAEQGFDVSALKKQAVNVADLGEQEGSWLIGMTHDGQITIDDDAANHGWSLGVGKVAPGKVDLMSVLLHEIGHLLGLEHDQLGDSLGVGIRQWPQLHESDESLTSIDAVEIVGLAAEPALLQWG